MARDIEEGLTSPGAKEDFGELCKAGCFPQGLALLTLLLRHSRLLETFWIEIVGQPSNREKAVRTLESAAQTLESLYADAIALGKDVENEKINEELWARKSIEWQAEDGQILALMHALEVAKPERFLDAARILELANKAYFLYVRQSPVEQAKLLKIVLSNCAIDIANIYPTYSKPFDLIFDRTKTGEWRAREDSNL